MEAGAGVGALRPGRVAGPATRGRPADGRGRWRAGAGGGGGGGGWGGRRGGGGGQGKGGAGGFTAGALGGAPQACPGSRRRDRSTHCRWAAGRSSSRWGRSSGYQLSRR